MPIRPPANPTSAAPARPKFGAPGAAPTTAPLPMGFQTPPVVASPAPVQTPSSAAVMGSDIFDVPAEDFNPAAEAAETIIPQPPDDGDHVCELSLVENREAYREITWERKDKEGRTQSYGAVSVSLVATITNPQDAFNGRRVYFDINSFGKKAVGAEGSTNDIALVLNALGEAPTGRPKTDAYRVQELVKNGYNKLIVQTEWHANFPYDKDDPKSKQKSKRPYKVGQENFPRDDAGIPQPLYETPSGEPLRTIAVPVAFKRLTT